MVNEQKGAVVVPNPQTLRTFGILNIIFGSLLILAAGGYAFSIFVYPKIFKGFQRALLERQAAEKAEREARIAQLKKEEDAAKTKEEKEELKEEREALQAAVVPDLTELTDVEELSGLKDMRVVRFRVAELTAAAILNTLLIVSGAGLLRVREWGRRLAIWVAELKILRWILMTIVMMVLVLPIAVDRTQRILAKVEAQIKVQGKSARPMPFNVNDLGRITAIAGAAGEIFSAIVASIYPIVLIWFLSRPQARAACLRELVPLEPQKQLEAGEF